MTLRILLAGILFFYHFSVFAIGASGDKPNTIVIYGLIRGEKDFDSITVKYSDGLVHPLTQVRQLFEKKYALTNAGFESYGDRSFRCEIPAGNVPGYLSLRIGLNNLIFQYLVEPNDSIKIRIDCNNNLVLFGGPAAEKFRCQYDMQVAYESRQLDSDTYMETFDKIAEFDGDSMKMIAFENRYKGFGKKLTFIETSPQKNAEMLKVSLQSDILQNNPEWQVLTGYKNRLGHLFFEVLRANILGKHLMSFAQSVRTNLGFASDSNQLLDVWKRFYAEKLNDWQSLPGSIPDSMVVHSAFYMGYLSERILLEARLFKKQPYDVIVEKTTGVIRDHLIGLYLIYRNNGLQNGQQLYERALALVKDSSIHNMLLKFYNRDKKGVVMPVFILWNEKEQPVTIQDFKGKVVFVDCWFTGCGACKDFYQKTLNKVEAHFRDNKKVVFLTVSIDNKKVWKRSLLKGDYTSDHAVNLYTGSLSINHPFIQHFDIHSFPHQMLIGSDGAIFQTSGLRLPEDQLIMKIEAALQQTGLKS